jgi:hypothetical protein
MDQQPTPPPRPRQSSSPTNPASSAAPSPPSHRQQDQMLEAAEPAQARVATLSSLERDLAGEDPPGESYLDKLGRLRMARLRAQEILHEANPQAQQDQQDWEEDQDDAPDSALEAAEPAWIPVREDPDHPYWQTVRAQDPQP